MTVMVMVMEEGDIRSFVHSLALAHICRRRL